MTAPFRLGLVGAGAVAQSYCAALKGLESIKLCGIADCRSAAAEAAAEAMGCAWFDDHITLVERAECDGVIICTPPVTHVDIGRDLLSRHIPVLIEKPLSTDLEGAFKLRATAERTGTVMTMASKFRYVEDMIRSKALIESGGLGSILHCDVVFTGRLDLTGRWNIDPKVSGGGVLIDNGTHAVDIIRFLLGAIDSVSVVEPGGRRQYPVEDTVVLFLRTALASSAAVELSWTVHKPLDSFVDVYGSAGTLQIGWSRSRYRVHGSADWIHLGSGYDKVDAFRRQLKNFCAAIRSGEPLLIDHEDAIASVATIQAAYRALKTGGWQAVNEIDQAQAAE
jgi:predicted dehydrogenase